MLKTHDLLLLLWMIWLPTQTCLAGGPGDVADFESLEAWVSSKIEGKRNESTRTAYLKPNLDSGRLLKNMATTKVYHKELGSLPLKIVDQVYEQGLYCPSTGQIVVQLPGPAKRFQAEFGIDSNRVESFYSNAGRGNVLGLVEVDAQEVFRSPVMREGLEAVPVDVDLQGSTTLTLRMKDAGGGVVERVDFNQSDWANARVELENGQVLWLGDLPIAPLAEPPDNDVPFSFLLDGQSSRELLANWKRNYQQNKIDEFRVEHTLTLDDPQSRLQFKLMGIEYLDFPVIEWKLVIENQSDQISPIIERILPLDLRLARDNEGEFLLHHSNGSPHSLVKMSDETDYAPRKTPLPPSDSIQLGSQIGLPASQDLPFYNLEFNQRGMIGAIGWPGQWKALFQRNEARQLTIQAGQELTRFRLHPGEKVRTPLMVLMFWKGGDWIDSQNLWRRWMITHNLPRTSDHQLPPPQIAASSSAFYMESTDATQENQQQFIDRYLQNGMKPDYWWIDAGWYEYDDYWLNVGTWNPNALRFPQGIKPISNYLHQNDMQMILWFTPECVARGSFIDRQHPQWLLKGGAEWWMGHALMQGEYPGHVNDSGLTIFEDVAAFGIGNPTKTAVGKTRLSDGNWHLVTGTRRVDTEQERSEIGLYIDGKLEAIAYSPNTQRLDANDSWGVGRQFQNRGLVGQLDDVRVYHRALSAEQVQAIYRRNDPPKADHRYEFNGDLTDETGTQQGEQIGSGDLVFSSGVSEQQGDQSLDFNNEYGVKVPNETPKDFTLSCWVRMTRPQDPPWGRGDFRLFDMGNEQARAWLVDHIDQRIREQGVDFYRHDGIPPLAYWRANDAMDRQGISEIKHCEGLLAYWDELRRRHPMLRIDICSGGGSRNELETLRRAVPLWRSDYAYEPTGMQTLTYGMSLWIPYFGTGVNATDPYTFHSQLAPAVSLSWDVRRKEIDFAKRRNLLAEGRKVLANYYGDFYPLTSYSTASDAWIAWQFNRPEMSTGMIQAFRRPDNRALTMQFPLKGLKEDAHYRVHRSDGTESVVVSGLELMQEGLPITLDEPRSSAVFFYDEISQSQTPPNSQDPK